MKFCKDIHEVQSCSILYLYTCTCQDHAQFYSLFLREKKKKSSNHLQNSSNILRMVVAKAFNDLMLDMQTGHVLQHISRLVNSMKNKITSGCPNAQSM